MRSRTPIARSALALALNLLWTASVLAAQPIQFVPGPGGFPLPPNRDIWWSEPPDLEGFIWTSERIPEFGFESETANDFIADRDLTISLARWWGGYFNYTLGDSLVTSFYLRFFEDDDCLPGALVQEVIIPGNANEMPIYWSGYDLICAYYYSLEFQVSAGRRYWFVAQGEHSFPPQWGRLQSVDDFGCDFAFRSEYLGYPDWEPGLCSLPPIFPCDVSQEFEVEPPTPVLQTNWGRIKSLYR